MSIIPKLHEHSVKLGTEEFWIPAALAAAGTGVNYVNQKQASNRKDAALTQSLINQGKIQSEATSKVNQLTRNIGADSPANIAAKEEGDLVSTLRKNAVGSKQGGTDATGLPTSSLTNIGGSSRYTQDVKNSGQQSQEYGDDLASQISGIDAATRQRQNEGLAASTVGTELNLLGAKSYTQDFVDRLRAEANGQQSPWLTLLGGGLSAAGGSLSKNMGGTKATSSVKPGALASAFSGYQDAPQQSPYGAWRNG